MKTISTLRTIFSFALTLAAFALLALLLHVSNFRTPIVSAQQSDYSQLRAEAEQAYASGSYARANDIYSKVKKPGLPPAEARWVEFRLADTSWRAQAGTATSDNTKFEQAQKQLEELIRTNDKEDGRDFVWAESHESLADLFWTRRNQMNWGTAWPHYQQALDWWAGQSEIERARATTALAVAAATDHGFDHAATDYAVTAAKVAVVNARRAIPASAVRNNDVFFIYFVYLG